MKIRTIRVYLKKKLQSHTNLIFPTPLPSTDYCKKECAKVLFFFSFPPSFATQDMPGIMQTQGKEGGKKSFFFSPLSWGGGGELGWGLDWRWREWGKGKNLWG